MFITIKKGTIDGVKISNAEEVLEKATKHLQSKGIQTLKLNPDYCIMPDDFYNFQKDYAVNSEYDLGFFLISNFACYHLLPSIKKRYVSWTVEDITIEFICS